MLHGIAVLIVLAYFIIVVIFMTILWRISSSLDAVAKSLADVARDVSKLADKCEK